MIIVKEWRIELFAVLINISFMRTLLLILISFAAFTALPAGIMMIYQPDGSSLGLSTSMLDGTPFKDFLVPGLVLAGIVGGINAIGLFVIMSGNVHSYKFSLLCGIVLVGWIVTQLMLFQYYYWQQGLYLLTGILIILLSYHLMGKAAF